DNGWGISATAREMRAMNAFDYAGGFKGMERMIVDGADFVQSYEGIRKAIQYVRTKRRPVLVQANCPLLGHHTSGVRKEWYREDLEVHARRDPLTRFRHVLLEGGVSESQLQAMNTTAVARGD